MHDAIENIAIKSLQFGCPNICFNVNTYGMVHLLLGMLSEHIKQFLHCKFHKKFRVIEISTSNLQVAFHYALGIIEIKEIMEIRDNNIQTVR